MSMGKHVAFHPTMAVQGEKQPEDLIRSSSRILVCTKTQEVMVNPATVIKDTELFKSTQAWHTLWVANNRHKWCRRGSHGRATLNLKLEWQLSPG
jgi:hypothetical protein